MTNRRVSLGSSFENSGERSAYSVSRWRHCASALTNQWLLAPFDYQLIGLTLSLRPLGLAMAGIFATWTIGLLAHESVSRAFLLSIALPAYIILQSALLLGVARLLVLASASPARATWIVRLLSYLNADERARVLERITPRKLSLASRPVSMLMVVLAARDARLDCRRAKAASGVRIAKARGHSFLPLASEACSSTRSSIRLLK